MDDSTVTVRVTRAEALGVVCALEVLLDRGWARSDRDHLRSALAKFAGVCRG